MRWRRIANVNEIIEKRSLVSLGPKIKLVMTSRRVALSGNTGWLKIKYSTGEYAIIFATSGLILKILEAA